MTRYAVASFEFVIVYSFFAFNIFLILFVDNVSAHTDCGTADSTESTRLKHFASAGMTLID
jgi:hypothetical protein